MLAETTLMSCCGDVFQPSSSNTPTYKMPVLLHDLAQLVSRDSCLRVEDKKSCLMPKYSSVRHSSLLCQNIQPSVLKMFHRYKNLCTFMSTSPIKEVPYEFFLNLQRLRLPKHLKNLNKLRHLELDVKRQISCMPLGLGKLTNLQMLQAFIVGKDEGRALRS
ncbi:hypothetical protein FNV43_RR00215 [Rhamnella rubrinervis]|uniref:Uncharacterized protein n=1 Tax=Rhamnella rubrinervis TaxID=2594499 RepID=A0A8K0HMH3_9ROSA|nr:hypothetical protein FNV43_RR00215 [Rhamnella rubrinervis]